MSITDLAQTALAAGQGLLDGKPVIAPDHVVEFRLNICKSCEYHGKVFCKACGCVTEAKVRVAASHCPMDKWKRI